MKNIERRPASGSCARCRGALGLASLQENGRWFCSSACAEGRPGARERAASVPEAWLTHRPRRHFRKRAPKELQRAGARGD